jgi:hypothetical protein
MRDSNKTVMERDDGLRITTSIGPGGDEEEVHEHPSFGMIQVNRFTVGGFGRNAGTGGVRFFGSSIENHLSGIRISISHAERHHSLSRDWYYNKGDSVIVVDLSPAQFAELITSLNAGSGVPCTIQRFNGERVPDLPRDIVLEKDKVRKDFAKKCEKATQEIRRAKASVEAILEKKSITQADRKEIVAAFNKTIQEVSRNMPFVLTQFEEAAEKVVTAAQAEIEATVNNHVTREGLKAVLERMGGEQEPQLAAGGECDEHGNLLDE